MTASRHRACRRPIAKVVTLAPPAPTLPRSVAMPPCHTPPDQRWQATGRSTSKLCPNLCGTLSHSTSVNCSQATGSQIVCVMRIGARGRVMPSLHRLHARPSLRSRSAAETVVRARRETSARDAHRNTPMGSAFPRRPGRDASVRAGAAHRDASSLRCQQPINRSRTATESAWTMLRVRPWRPATPVAPTATDLGRSSLAESA